MSQDKRLIECSNRLKAHLSKIEDIELREKLRRDIILFAGHSFRSKVVYVCGRNFIDRILDEVL